MRRRPSGFAEDAKYYEWVIAHRSRIEKRFAKFAKAQPNGCIRWTGHGNGDKYAQIDLTIDGKHVCLLVHRVRWMLDIGPIPLKNRKGRKMTMDHICRLGICVNIQHLEVVTNPIQAERKVTARKGKFQKPVHYRLI